LRWLSFHIGHCPTQTPSYQQLCRYLDSVGPSEVSMHSCNIVCSFNSFAGLLVNFSNRSFSINLYYLKLSLKYNLNNHMGQSCCPIHSLRMFVPLFSASLLPPPSQTSVETGDVARLYHVSSIYYLVTMV